MSLFARVTEPQGRVSSDRSASRPTPSYEQGTAYVLAVAGSIMRRQWVEALARLDVTPTQFKVIIVLETTGPLGQRELAELVGIDPRNCGPVLDALTERALLARETDSVDRRRRLLRLTLKGTRLARELESANAATEDELRKRLGPTEYASLRERLLPIIAADKPNG